MSLSTPDPAVAASGAHPAATSAATTAPGPMLVCRDLRKSYGRRIAVDGVGFEIAAGETYGLLGPNGAGKTTSIAMIAAWPSS